MIDLGLTKLAVIGAIALVVIGPEKLPKVARTLGTLYGRAQRYIRDVKSEVSREMDLEELRKMHKEASDAAQDIGGTIAQTVYDARDDLHSAWDPHHADASRPLDADNVQRKAREFRRKKLVRTSAVPAWYKQRTNSKQHVISGAARVARYRPGNRSKTGFYS
ncbi:MAG TPA: Sec-independent protein translocase protein TatB [Burkholderiaceae bacterium]